MLTCEYLSDIGYSWLLGTPHAPRDEDDAESIEQARRLDHDRVAAKLLDERPKALPFGAAGVSWHGAITWPDRVPGMVTWSGQQTLTKLITTRQDAIKKSLDPGQDPRSLSVGLTGASGIDPLACVDAIDAGFSPTAHGMAIAQRPAVELLAIVGLERVPLVSFAVRECGFVAAGALWRFAVELRAGGYYHRWGDLQVAEWGPMLRRWAELDSRVAL